MQDNKIIKKIKTNIRIKTEKKEKVENIVRNSS